MKTDKRGFFKTIFLLVSGSFAGTVKAKGEQLKKQVEDAEAKALAIPPPPPSAPVSASPTPSISLSVSPSPSRSISTSPSPSMTPSSSPSPSMTASSSPSPSLSPTSSPSPSLSVSPSPSPSPSTFPSVSPSSTPSISTSTSPSPTPSTTVSAPASVTPSSTPSNTVSPSTSPSPSPSPSAVSSASPTPSNSITPSASPSLTPSMSPLASATPSPSTVLPVDLLYFEVKPDQNNSASLSWATATETNNLGFEIQRSTDLNNFKKTGWIQGYGNSSRLRTYTYKDKGLEPNITYYYRLKQIDTNAEYKIYDVKSVTLNTAYTEFGDFYPNPATGQFFLTVNAMQPLKMSINFYDTEGRRHAEKSFNLKRGINKLEIPAAGWRPGIYIGQVLVADKVFFKRIVIY